MLLLTPSVSGLFKWRQFEPEVILLAVGWYLRFSLSYRDVEELLVERGVRADHVTVVAMGPALRPGSAGTFGLET
jgi:IS6 family transposase